MVLTQSYLKKILHYEPETGEWTWAYCPPPNQRYTGTPAGYFRSDGYKLIRIRGRAYYSGRLAWFYMTGQWPNPEVDHEDTNPSNDRWSNLREATSSQNKFNRLSEKSLRGVYRTGNKWWAMCGRDNYLGTFDTLEEACAARDAEALRLGGEFAILNSNLE